MTVASRWALVLLGIVLALLVAACGGDAGDDAAAAASTTTEARGPSTSQDGADEPAASTGAGLPTAQTLDAEFPTAPTLETLFPEQAPLHPETLEPPCEGSIRLRGSHFDPGAWDILPAAEDTIAAALATLEGYEDDWRIIVYGHTDKRPYGGLPGGNDELSELRAQAVVDRLIELGLDPARVEAVVGVGAAELLSDEDTPEAHAQNRRVDIVRYCSADGSAS